MSNRIEDHFKKIEALLAAASAEDQDDAGSSAELGDVARIAEKLGDSEAGQAFNELPTGLKLKTIKLAGECQTLAVSIKKLIQALQADGKVSSLAVIEIVCMRLAVSAAAFQLLGEEGSKQLEQDQARLGMLVHKASEYVKTEVKKAVAGR